MKFKLINMWKDGSDFKKIDILSFGIVDCQYYIIICNFSFIFEVGFII